MLRSRILLLLLAFAVVVPDRASTAEYDHLCGWYKVAAEDRLIPVFKIEGSYYTVMRRGGFEVPLQASSEGLEWPRDVPSSMAGTKIGFDAEKNEVYISVCDEIRKHHDDTFTSGERQPMTKVARPEWLRDAKAKPPRTLEDFRGWYQPAWFPYARAYVRDDKGQYLLEFQIIHKDDEKHSWRPEPDGPKQLTPLKMGLGFLLQPEVDQEKDSSLQLVYSAKRKRFELQARSAETKPYVLRMPLARIPSPSPDAEEASPPPMEIGIPSWE